MFIILCIPKIILIPKCCTVARLRRVGDIETIYARTIKWHLILKTNCVSGEFTRWKITILLPKFVVVWSTNAVIMSTMRYTIPETTGVVPTVIVCNELYTSFDRYCDGPKLFWSLSARPASSRVRTRDG